jgi:hypothetical protein
VWQLIRRRRDNEELGEEPDHDGLLKMKNSED